MPPWAVESEFSMPDLLKAYGITYNFLREHGVQITEEELEGEASPEEIRAAIDLIIPRRMACP
jgi:hypothetical protein